ncbi:MAG: ParB N-terminal domain-containing protein, partial [Opitutaceae bacterium]
MEIVTKKISELRPYPKNPRHNDHVVERFAAHLVEYGWRAPIVVDETGEIICGHLRWKAARHLGWEDVPVHVASDLSPEQVRALRIADNKTAEWAEWDEELLRVELEALLDAGVSRDKMGFADEDEFNAALGEAIRDGLADPDAIPEPPDEATTQRGDVYVLGDHRLMCGDSASGADLDRL